MNNKDKPARGTLSQTDEMASLLPFYITGRLGLRDQIRVRQWLDEYPLGQKALENAFADQRASIDANEAINSPPGALGRLLKDIDKTPSKGWSGYVGGDAFSWLMGWLNIIPSPLIWGVVGALLLVTAIQSTLLLTGDRDIAEENTAKGTTADTLPAIKGPEAFIRFAPHTGIDEISALLNSVGAVITDGPRGQNAYVIRFRQDKSLPPVEKRMAELQRRADLVHFIAGKKP